MEEFDVQFILTNGEVGSVMSGHSVREVNDKLCKKLSSEDPTLQLDENTTVVKSHIQYFHIHEGKEA
ncbi:hypothetical protein ACFFGV_06865 [Pontibacillus salicampi]|uniref:DUF3906 family protein n=1 Tax=Pontibacillus salicampi TaxID=1449801 RepID=A0ABV6LLM1_9BACI